MRNRTPNPSTPLDPTESWVYSVTEKGLRACGAASMMENAASLRQAADNLEKAADRLHQEIHMPKNGAGKRLPKAIRRGTVCGRFRNDTRVPDLRLSGKWLRTAGFDLGRKFQIKVDTDQLTIRAEPKPGIKPRATQQRQPKPASPKAPSRVSEGKG